MSHKILQFYEFEYNVAEIWMLPALAHAERSVPVADSPSSVSGTQTFPLHR